VREKSVVLSIANALYKLLEKEPGFTPVLVRSGDYYVGLRERINVARKDKADLFISIHVNHSSNSSAHGSETYF